MSIIKEGVSRVAGNSLASYRWQVVRCDTCCGSGEIDLHTTEDLRKALVGAGLSFAERRRVVEEGIATCPECHGKGEWEEWL